MRPGTPPLTIRPTAREDRSPIELLLHETQVFTGPEVDVAMELIDAFLGVPATEDYELRTAVDERGEVIGYYCVGPTPMTAATFDLYWIAVKPSHHGQGAGRELLRHAEALAVSQGCRLLIAETSSQPKYGPTRAFYLRNSYRELARIEEYYRPGDDLVIYGKYFSQQR